MDKKRTIEDIISDMMSSGKSAKDVSTYLNSVSRMMKDGLNDQNSSTLYNKTKQPYMSTNDLAGVTDDELKMAKGMYDYQSMGKHVPVSNEEMRRYLPSQLRKDVKLASELDDPMSKITRAVLDNQKAIQASKADTMLPATDLEASLSDKGLVASDVKNELKQFADDAAKTTTRNFKIGDPVRKAADMIGKGAKAAAPFAGPLLTAAAASELVTNEIPNAAKTRTIGDDLDAAGNLALLGAGIGASTGVGAIPAIGVAGVGAGMKGLGYLAKDATQDDILDAIQRMKGNVEDKFKTPDRYGRDMLTLPPQLAADEQILRDIGQKKLASDKAGFDKLGNAYLDKLIKEGKRIPFSPALKMQGPPTPPAASQEAFEEKVENEMAPLDKDAEIRKNEEMQRTDASYVDPIKAIAEGLLNRQLGFTNDTVENYKKAQELANQNVLMANIMGGMNKVSAGLLGLNAKSVVKPDESLTQDLLKTANQPVQTWEKATQTEKSDPNSTFSLNFKEAVRPLMGGLGIDPANFDRLSAEQIATVAPFLVRQYDSLLDNERQKLSLQNKAQENLEKNDIRRDAMRDRIVNQSFNDTEVRDNTKRVNAVNRLYGTVLDKVGVNLQGAGQEEIQKLDDQKLNEIPQLLITELGQELNSLLTNSAVTPASTLNKLLPDDLQRIKTNASAWLKGKPTPAKKAAFIKLVLSTAERQGRVARKHIEEKMKKRVNASSLKESMTPQQLENLLTEMGVDSLPEETPKSSYPKYVEGTNPKTGKPGKIKVVNAEEEAEAKQLLGVK